MFSLRNCQCELTGTHCPGMHTRISLDCGRCFSSVVLTRCLSLLAFFWYELLPATHCNALQRTATHCNTLQHTATQCNALQHTAIHCNTLQHTPTPSFLLIWVTPRFSNLNNHTQCEFTVTHCPGIFKKERNAYMHTHRPHVFSF